MTFLGCMMNETGEGWDNFMGRVQAAQLVKEGTCPWCGRKTTIVSKILLGRFESDLASMSKYGSF
jgi:hypothetical protein